MSEERLVETRVRRYTAEEFIENPALFEQVRRMWEGKQWFALFGEWPLGAVMARLPDEGGIEFYYKVKDDT